MFDPLKFFLNVCNQTHWQELASSIFIGYSKVHIDVKLNSVVSDVF